MLTQRVARARTLARRGRRGIVLPSAYRGHSLQAVQAAPWDWQLRDSGPRFRSDHHTGVGRIKLMASTKIKLGLASLITAAWTAVSLNIKPRQNLDRELPPAQSRDSASTTDNQTA
jgi:hypothetical protein